jgi:uncharacterized protein YigE (DUF2233 family)
VLRLSRALLFLIVAVTARGEWAITSTQAEASIVPGIEHRHVVLQESESGEGATVDLAIFPAKSSALRVVDNADGEANLADAMPQNKCVAGVNGGYFDPNFAPIGLRVIDGKTVKPLVRARLLTGVLMSTSQGIRIARLSEYSKSAKPDAALECGPFLVDLGVAVRGLNDTRAARRTFAAVDRRDHAAFGICSSASLAGAGKILSSVALAPDFKIWRALNLDGGSSSAFWFKRKDGSAFAISEQKSVRDFVGVVPR